MNVFMCVRAGMLCVEDWNAMCIAYSIVLYIVLYCTVLCSTEWHSIELYCNVMDCNILRILLYCVVLQWHLLYIVYCLYVSPNE